MFRALFLLALAASLACSQNLTLHFIATDGQGNPVTDLTADEIRLTDEGKPLPIASFRSDRPRPAAALTAGELTNRPVALANVHVILLDLLNLPASDRRTTIDQLVRSLHVERPEALYVYLLNLQGELVPVRALPASAPVPAATPAMSEIPGAIEKLVGPIATARANYTTDVVFRSKSSYEALEKLSGQLSSVPGRKTISWITIGVPRTFPRENGDNFDSTPFLRQSAHRIAQAGVGIYPIAKLSGSDAPENRETLQALAELTGGKLYQGGDIERALPEVMQAVQATYRVQVAVKNWDGKFHRLRATSTRKGANLQYEQGYMAQKPQETDPAAAFKSPFDSNDLGIRATVSPGPQPNVIRLHLNLDAHDMKLDGPLQLVLSVGGYMPDGKLIAYAPSAMNPTLTPEQRDRAMRDGLRLGHDVTLAAGMRLVRLKIEDQGANVVGTLTIPAGN